MSMLEVASPKSNAESAIFSDRYNDDNVSDSERAYLQSHYDLLSQVDFMSRKSTAEGRVPDVSSTFDFTNDFDLIPIIEESTKKYRNFLSIIEPFLQNGNGRSPSLSINQYNMARLKLSSQLQKRSKNLPLDPRHKDLSMNIAGQTSPERELFDSGGAPGFGSPYASSGMYNTSIGHTNNGSGTEKVRDPLLLPVLGAAAYNRQNRLRSRASRSRQYKGVRNNTSSSSEANSVNSKQLYGTFESGIPYKSPQKNSLIDTDPARVNLAPDQAASHMKLPVFLGSPSRAVPQNIHNIAIVADSQVNTLTQSSSTHLSKGPGQRANKAVSLPSLKVFN